MLRLRWFLLYTSVLAIALLSTGCTLVPVAVDTALGLMPTPHSTADGDTLVFAPQAQTGTITFVSMPFGSPSVLTPPRTTVLTGTLTVQDNCLFIQSYCPVVNPINPECRFVPIWPGGYHLDTGKVPFQILDDSDRMVARVGERIAIRGAVGSLDLAQNVRQNLESQLPSQCGSLELVSVLELGGTVTEYTFDTETIQLPRQSAADVIKARNYAGVGPQVLTGTLTLSDGCLLVEDGDLLQHATPLWPPNVELVQNAGVIEVVDATGNVLARLWEEVNLLGGRADSSSVSLLRRIHVACRTPFWTVLP